MVPKTIIAKFYSLCQTSVFLTYVLLYFTVIQLIYRLLFCVKFVKMFS